MTGSKLTYSSELIQNFLQAEIMSPEGRFQALQTDSGLGLVFSQSHGALKLVQEQTGTASGWQFKDLSSAQLKKDFPGKSNITVKTFAVAQCALVQQEGDAKGTAIRLAMVINDTKQDYLYLSLDNSASDLAWADNPKWTSYPFDDPKTKCASLKILGVWLSNAVDAAHVMVDIARMPASTPEMVDRYYIDPHKKKETYSWLHRKLTIELQSNVYHSCSGRPAGEDSVEGHYTAGEVMGSPQFIFMPFFNAFDHSLDPSPARLQLPGKLLPSAIASCRNPADNATDLYVAAKGGLYFFASDKQQNDAEGKLILSSPLLNDVHELFANTDGEQIIVWGRNGSNEAFYTSCRLGRQASPQGWSLPLPILSKVSLISPYINRGNSANVFYASDGTNLFRMTKSPSTTLWTQQSITLPPNDKTPALSFSSYTTRLQLTNDSSAPQSQKPLHISASSRGGFFINGLYYVLNDEPVTIETDAMGSVTLIEASNGINGTCLTVYDDSGNTLTIDPMKKPMQKVFTLNSEDQLRQAQIVSSDGSSRPLVTETSSANLQAAAGMFTGLQATQTGLTTPANANGFAAADGGAAVDFGDIVSWLKSGLEHLGEIIWDAANGIWKIGERILEFVQDAATGLWKFVLKIGEKVYNAILDCAEKIAAAAEWVFDAIKVAIEEVVKYLSYIFDWNAITRTKKVLQNLIHLWIKDQVAGIGKIQSEVDGALDTMIAQLDSLAGISDWSVLGDKASMSLSSMAISMDGQDVSSNFLGYHFTNNQESLGKNLSTPTVSGGEKLLQDLIDALNSEQAVLDKTIEQFEDLLSQASSLSFGQILTKILAILGSGILSSGRVVIHALFDILKDVVSLILEWLETPITIPVLSDILASLGVPSLSILDLVCWVMAVPVTVGYKVIYGQAPFADDDNTKLLTGEIACGAANAIPSAANALSFAANDSGNGAPASVEELLTNINKALPDSAKRILFIVGQDALAVCAGLRVFTALEVALDEPNKYLSIPDTILAHFSEGLAIAIDMVAADQVEVSKACSIYNTVVKTLRGLVGVSLFLVLEGSKVKVGTDYTRRAVTSGVDTIVTAFCALGSAWHIGELAFHTDKTGCAIAILDEAAALIDDLACFSHCVAAIARCETKTGTVVKAGAIIIMEAAYLGVAGLHVAEAAVEAKKDVA